MYSVNDNLEVLLQWRGTEYFNNVQYIRFNLLFDSVVTLFKLYFCDEYFKITTTTKIMHTNFHLHR